MTFLINKQNPKHFLKVLVKMQKYNLGKRHLENQEIVILKPVPIITDIIQRTQFLSRFLLLITRIPLT